MAEYKDYGYQNDEPSHAFEYLREPLLSLLDKKVNTCILDLGCGNGHLANYLISLGFNAYGTDASDLGIAIARKVHPDRFFMQDLSTDSLPEGLKGIKFDTIISTEVIEHLYDPQGFIEFCKKAIGGKGEIIISTPYNGYLKNLALSIFNKWDAHINPLWYGGHIKLWSKATLTRVLENSGFKFVEFKGCGRFPYFWKSMIVKAQIA